MNPPVLRAPNDVMQERQRILRRRQPYYDPAKITVPTLLVVAE